MILNAEDDPVCSIKNLEPYKEPIQQMSTVAVVTTKKGVIVHFMKGGVALHGQHVSCLIIF